jgi:hypothetical protein
MCEVFFALSHKADFDANKPTQRFAALNKIITNFSGRELVMNVLLLLPHSIRTLSSRTARSSGHHALKSSEVPRFVVRDAA